MSDTAKAKWSKKKKIIVGVLSAFLVLLIMIVAGGIYALNWYCDPGEYTITPVNTSATLIGHRGLRSIAPENTVPSFEEAGKAGFWGAECDTYRTKDGVWVIHHDPIIYRMTGKIANIEKLTYEELLKYDNNNGINIDKYPELKICTLEEYLQICKKYNMVAVIEFKGKNNTEHYDEVVALVNQYEVDAIYISFKLDNIKAIRQLTDAPVYYLVQAITPEDIEAAKSIDNCGIDFNGNKEKNYEGDIIKQCQDAGLPLCAWTINDATVMDKLVNEYGVQFITTDQIVKE